MTRPASDWVSAFPEDDEPAPRTAAPTSLENEGPPRREERRLPPARKRTRQYRPAPSTTDEENPGPADTKNQGEEERPDYEVGYRKPPRHTRFKPGQSGNPKGRPRRAKSLNTIARESLTQHVMVRTSNGSKKISRIEAVLHKLVEQAMKGNPRALAELMKLYRGAVPEEKIDEQVEDRHEDLTAADLAILEAFTARQQAGRGDGS